MILCITRIITVSFPGTRNPPQNPFLCIFKHNQIFTYPSTASSDKVDMGCGFPVPRNSEPIPTLCEKAVERYVNTSLCLKIHKNGCEAGSGFLKTEPETDTPSCNLWITIMTIV